jgi:FAD dependent oxidoreductase TIGR03364
LNQASVIGGLYSPHELRVESRDAIPRLERWLGESKGVTFLWCTAVHDISLPEIHTSNGTLRAERGILCAGDDFRTLFPERFTAYETQICKLQMMRVIPSDGFGRLESAVMSDLSLVRYLGYSELPEARPLLERLLTEQGQALHYGIHLIVVQSRDGSLVVGDSHQIEHTPDCFVDSVVEAVILEELTKIMRVPDYRVSERWVGTYGMSNAGLVLIDRPSRGLRLVSVTSGTGASTAFGIAEKAISELL